MGERRLKNVGVVLEWEPEAMKEDLRLKVLCFHRSLSVGCKKEGCSNPHCASNKDVTALASKPALMKALQLAKAHSESPCVTPKQLGKAGTRQAKRWVVALSLSEGETIRRIIHANQSSLRKSGLALRDVEGNVVDVNGLSQVGSRDVSIAIQCFRFFNCEMYYTNKELELLLDGLQRCPIADRKGFFSECLRLRKRERRLWADTPLAKVLTDKEEWGTLKGRSQIQQVETAIRSKRGLQTRRVLARFDTDNDGVLNYEELIRAFGAMNLGFSPRDLSDIVRLADQDNRGRVSIEQFVSTFNVPEDVEHTVVMEEKDDTEPVTWTCSNCTFVNSVYENTCAMCDMGWSGKREVPKDKWMCAGEMGGCTFFNPDSQFYCEICNRSRPDMASVRF